VLRRATRLPITRVAVEAVVVHRTSRVRPASVTFDHPVRRSSDVEHPARGGQSTGDDERTTVSTEPTSTPTDAGQAPDVDAWARKARGALTRYRVMAWVTGTMLLLLCVEMVAKYVFHAGGFDAEGEPLGVFGIWVAIAHGWIYVLYLVTVFDLWSTLRWRIGRFVTMAAAGVVPVMSFVLERRVHADAQARIDAAAGPQA